MQYKIQHQSYKAFGDLLSATPELQKFVSKLQHLEQINNYLLTHLDPQLAPHCRVANLRDGALVLSTTSPAWNHKLRFAAVDILSLLRANPLWSGLKSIEVRVDYLVPKPHNTPTNFKTASLASAQNAKLIQQTATHISNNKLSGSLKRLALRLEQPPLLDVGKQLVHPPTQK